MQQAGRGRGEEGVTALRTFENIGRSQDELSLKDLSLQLKLPELSKTVFLWEAERGTGTAMSAGLISSVPMLSRTGLGQSWGQGDTGQFSYMPE